MLNDTYIENPTKPYCVYLTIYSGDKLPHYYIGSSSCNKVINKNYQGSVNSKKYGAIWKTELKNNPILFNTYIISEHDSRHEALQEEFKQQKIHNVVKSNSFINMSFAVKNGFFGMDTMGKNNPMFNKKHSKETLDLMSTKQSGKNNPAYGKLGIECHNYGIVRTPEQNEHQRRIRLGSKLSIETKKKIGLSGKGRIVTTETRNKISLKNTGHMIVFDYIDLEIKDITKEEYNEHKSNRYLMTRTKQYKDYFIIKDLDKNSLEYIDKVKSIVKSIIPKKEHAKDYIKPLIYNPRNTGCHHNISTKKLVSDMHRNTCNVLDLTTLETKKIPTEEFESNKFLKYISTSGKEYKLFVKLQLDKNSIEYKDNIINFLADCKVLSENYIISQDKNSCFALDLITFQIVKVTPKEFNQYNFTRYVSTNCKEYKLFKKLAGLDKESEEYKNGVIDFLDKIKLRIK